MKIEAFILTGGRSTRMDRDKASLDLGGITLTERAFSIAHEASLFSRVRSVAALPCDPGPVVFDRYEERGPLGGLHAALFAAETAWIFLLACDLPFVTPELIERLSSCRSNEVDAVVPVQRDGRVQPLCAFYRVEKCLPAAIGLLERDDSAALKELLQDLTVRSVAFDEITDLSNSEHFFRNINTPADLEEARRICGLPPVMAK